MRHTKQRCSCKAFTMIELLIVMAVIALLLSIAAPRYFHSVDVGKEAALRQDLFVMRDAIDKFRGDTGRYPESLAELVDKHYIRVIPADPITDRADSWVIVSPPELNLGSGVYDVKSGAEGKNAEGSAYSEW